MAKLLILSSTGGYGHMAAGEALEFLLGPDHEIAFAYPLKETGPGTEDAYNYLLNHQSIQTINLVSSLVAPQLMQLFAGQIEKVVDAHIQSHQPDLIISIIPFLNLQATEAARKRRIPYLLITLDNDLTTWALGLEELKHPDFQVTIGHDLPTTRSILEDKGIAPEAIHTIGLPLRAPFLQTPVQNKREELGIPNGKPVVMVMLGGQGGNTTVGFARHLLAAPIGIHLIACTGKNARIKKTIHELPMAAGNSRSIIPFTLEIPQLMATSDLLVTKPGPGVINEAMAMGLPMLLDATNPPLYWEAPNFELVSRLGIGDVISLDDDVAQVVSRALAPNQLRLFREAYQQAPVNRFAEMISHLVTQMTQRPLVP